MSLIRTYCIVFVASSTFIIDSLSAQERLPPVGKRIYLVDPNGSPYQPPKILRPNQNPGRVNQVILKDPILNKKPIQVPAPRKVMKRQSSIGIKEANLKFSKLNVAGRYSEPRIKFKTDHVLIGRAEENLDLDYLNQIIESAKEQETLATDPIP